MREEKRRQAAALQSVFSFLFGLEHVGGDFGDEAARDEAFAVGAEIVAEAGDDVAFAGGQGFQPGVGDFFGGFGVAFEFFLAGNGVEFGFRRAGAESADADSVGFHFFGEAFGEEEIEGFCGGVSRNVGNGLEGSGGRENENIAASAGDHLRQVQTGQVHDRVTIHLDHIEQALRFNGMQFAVLAETGVINEQIDLDTFFFRESENFFRSIRIGQVRGEDLGGDFVSCGQPARQFVEAILPPRCEYELCSAGCQFFG